MALFFSLFVDVIPTLLANAAMYDLLIISLAKFSASAISPNNAILLSSLEVDKIIYKEYIKNT